MAQPIKGAIMVPRFTPQELAVQLERYARLLVRKACNLKEGQILAVSCPACCEEFAAMVAQAAYEAGASDVVTTLYSDKLTRLDFMHRSLESFKTVPEWMRIKKDGLAEDGAAFLFLEGSNPEALKGVDAAKIATASKASSQQCKVFRHHLDFALSVWSIAGVATKEWAAHVFPDLDPDEALHRLWETILFTARATSDDPIATWEQHNSNFVARKAWLNEQHFDALHYQNSAGTNFTVGLTSKHLWDGGSGALQNGHQFFPNVPTEECYTVPDRLRADGVVYATLPLSYSGNIIDRFWFKFEGGKIVDFGAETGYEVLKSLLDIDDGARHLGEVALVPKESPINQTGLLFFSTLYDENASCHLAFGKGFAECYEGGLDMTNEQLIEVGVNHSDTHVDFMIGSDDLSITGIKSDGTEVPVFRDGTWAFDVE